MVSPLWNPVPYNLITTFVQLFDNSKEQLFTYLTVKKNKSSLIFQNHAILLKYNNPIRHLMVLLVSSDPMQQLHVFKFFPKSVLISKVSLRFYPQKVGNISFNTAQTCQAWSSLLCHDWKQLQQVLHCWDYLHTNLAGKMFSSCMFMLLTLWGIWMVSGV